MILSALAVVMGMNAATTLPPSEPKTLYPSYILPPQFSGPVVYPDSYEPLIYVSPSGHYPHHDYPQAHPYYLYQP